MGKPTPTKEERNKKLVALKTVMSFRELAKMFKISETRAKQIYYREIKKNNEQNIEKKTE